MVSSRNLFTLSGNQNWRPFKFEFAIFLSTVPKSSVISIMVAFRPLKAMKDLKMSSKQITWLISALGISVDLEKL